MAANLIMPFRATHFARDAGDLESLVTQPYDKIDAHMQDKYYAHEHSFCRLVLPREKDRYEVSRQRLNDWLNEGVLVSDDTAPAFYVHFQDFTAHGKQHVRKGFVAAVRLHPFSDDVILPHEKTHSGPKIDRLKMLEATEHHLEPGFMLYSDPQHVTTQIFDRVAAEHPPWLKVTDDLGVTTTVWKLDDAASIERVQRVFDGQQLVIADGHHRYETSVAYRDQRRAAAEKDGCADAAFNFGMTYLVPVEDQGLVILATHRLLTTRRVSDSELLKLSDSFQVCQLPLASSIHSFLAGQEKGSSDKIDSKNSSSSSHRLVLYQNGTAYGLTLRDTIPVAGASATNPSEPGAVAAPEAAAAPAVLSQLDVVILRDRIFHEVLGLCDKDLVIDETLYYQREIHDAVAMVDSGKASCAFILNATHATQVLNVAKARERMPQKSTDFFPKVISGLVLMSLREGELL